jgi:hypothetical protein
VRRHQRPFEPLKLLPFLPAQLDPKVGLPHADHPQQLASNGKVFGGSLLITLFRALY